MFEGQVIIITGAAGGFGRAAAAHFAAKGARLVLADMKPFPGPAGDHLCLVADVAEPTAHERMVAAALERFGRLDGAINNAGIAHPMLKLPDIPLDAARRVIDVDLMGVFYALRAQLPAMERGFKADQQPRAILNIASAAGTGGAAGLSVYAAAKHGVVGLTRSAALEYARRGIRVNALCPAFTRTDMVTGALDANNPQAETDLVRGIPMRRMGSVAEVVAAIEFAMNPANGFMTGHCLQVDGGLGAM